MGSEESRAGEEIAGRPTSLDLLEIPHRVLLIEPSEIERRWVRNELIAGQIDVFEATDLITALRAIGLFKPNLILAQLRLPTFSGLELVRRLKEEAATDSIPVLLYSEIATADERIRAFELGATDFVTKPFVGAELLARVRLGLRTRHFMTILEQRAQLDGLTGLANRGFLEDRLPREWEACRRRGTSMAVLMSDLDRFKLVNDTHGHAAGDEVLRQAASCLVRCVRTSDLVARYGGEELVVVAPDCDLTAAVKLAERFRMAVAGLQLNVRGTVIEVSASTGVAASGDAARINPAELLQRADDALYQAKQSGRNATWFWDQRQGRSEPVQDYLLTED
jgi:diguanylate cyclase (GGDEF)-like protein